jgi:putative endonuclease
MAYTVYILQSETMGSYYIGSTADLRERLQRHNQGRSRYTKTGIPWKIVYTEKFDTRSHAVKRKRQIKNRKSKAYIEALFRTSRM